MNKGAQATEITWIHGNFRKSLKNTNSRGCFDQFNDPVREPYINGRLLYSVNWIFLVTRAITVPVFNLRCYFLKLRCKFYEIRPCDIFYGWWTGSFNLLLDVLIFHRESTEIYVALTSWLSLLTCMVILAYSWWTGSYGMYCQGVHKSNQNQWKNNR